MKFLMLTNCDFTDSWFDCLYVGLIECGYTAHIIPDKEYYHITGCYDKFTWNLPKQPSYEEILVHLSEYDCLIIGSIYHEIKSGKYVELINSFKGQLVVYQAHDNPMDYDYKSAIQKPFIEFRKESYDQYHSHYGMIHPNREAYNVPNIREKIFSICGIFSPKICEDGSLSKVTKKRNFVCDLLQKDFPNSIFLPMAQLNFYSFRELTSLSRIGLNLKGMGEQNSRYYEIPSFNSFLLTERVNCYIPDDFVEGWHKESFDIPEDYESLTWYPELKDKINWILSDHHLLEQRTISAYEHTCKYHNLYYNVGRFMGVLYGKGRI